MIINEMFKKSIDREYEGVIKVGQHENENLQQELEEYVVTDELAAHFKTFFNAYEKPTRIIENKWHLQACSLTLSFADAFFVSICEGY